MVSLGRLATVGFALVTAASVGGCASPSSTPGAAGGGDSPIECPLPAPGVDSSKNRPPAADGALTQQELDQQGQVDEDSYASEQKRMTVLLQSVQSIHDLCSVESIANYVPAPKSVGQAVDQAASVVLVKVTRLHLTPGRAFADVTVLRSRDGSLDSKTLSKVELQYGFTLFQSPDGSDALATTPDPGAGVLDVGDSAILLLKEVPDGFAVGMGGTFPIIGNEVQTGPTSFKNSAFYADTVDGMSADEFFASFVN